MYVGARRITWDVFEFSKCYIIVLIPDFDVYI